MSTIKLNNKSEGKGASLRDAKNYELVFSNELIKECEGKFLNKYRPFVRQAIFPVKELFTLHSPSVEDLINNKTLVKLLEDLMILVKMFTDANSKSDYAMAIVVFTKLRLGDQPILHSDFFKKLTSYFNQLCIVRQSDGDTPFAPFREVLDKYSAIKNSAIVEKLYKFSMYALSLSLFSKAGVTFDSLKYTRVERAALQSKYHLGPDFIHCLLDTLVFLCERGYQCMKTGEISPLFHSIRTYEQWYDDSLVLKNKARQLQNCEAHGFSEFEFRADLDTAIEKGESIVKFAFELDTAEKLFARKVFNELQMIKSDCVTRAAARENRTPPFSILVSGDSSIGKSSIMEMLYAHYGKRSNLPVDSTYKYTRNAAAKFWDGFTTSQWCVIFDDIAFMHPNKAAQGDPTVMEIIQLINAVPFTPDQAALDDKGRTPVRAKLVIASTNTENLNAHHYFSCPSAVQRRFPFIVVPKIKNEYLGDDYKTLDSSKCPQDQVYPDLWTYTVKKVTPVPVQQGVLGGQAITEEILIDVDLKTFLIWYNNAITEHNSNQNRVKVSIDRLHNAPLCSMCGLPDSLCTCIVEKQSGLYSYLLYSMIWKLFFTIFDRIFGISYLWFFMFNTWIGQWLSQYLWCHLDGRQRNTMERSIISSLGRGITLWMNPPTLICYIGVTLTSAISMYTLKELVVSFLRPRPEHEVLQTGEGTRPKATGFERENVWYKNDFTMSSFSYTPQQATSKGVSLEEFSKRLTLNLVHLNIHSEKTSKTLKTGACCIKGNMYILNKHAIPDDKLFQVDVISSSRKDGVTSNNSLILFKSNFVDLGQDLVLVEIKCLPPKADISSYFAKRSFTGVWNGSLINRSGDGSIKHNYIKCAKLVDADWMPDVKGKHWQYHPSTLTQNGDCGGLVVLEAQGGFVIAGIHYAGLHGMFENLSSPMSAAIPLHNETLVDMIKHNDVQVVPTAPMLESDSVKTVLLPLHRNSPIRFIEKGSCHVFGSLSGMRANQRSKVERSIMCDYLEEKGYKLLYTQPSMGGWEPKRKALLEIMSMEHRFDNNILDKISLDMSALIVAKLGHHVKQLEVYDDFTAINGAAGVAYVDKMNRKTSAGFPWKRSKQFFMNAIPAEGQNLEPVQMNDEIMSRVFTIIDKYKKGEMCHPVFTASLKDEPVTFAKSETHATRVFMGAPVDWSIVVRKYCLSFIRLVQSNRMIFECGAGTVAQSDEWHNYRDWLCTFGADRIVAGDYSKFDKRMGGEIILSAFKVITEIMRASDMLEEDILVVEGIARDTSYPMVDYFGDLMQFNGCNPSGHPLTVIINSIANSIYMRYCYFLLNPEHEIESFQDNVHLMTYGDDNIMGISRDAEWFNHTSISTVLDLYGVRYTMAEKEKNSVPYIHIDDASFLKRKWLYCSDMGKYLAALDEESIHKMCMIWIPSDEICPEQHAVQCLNTAVAEYFFYGKLKFNERRVFYLELIKELELELYYKESPFPTWDEFKLKYEKSSVTIQRLEELSLNQKVPPSFSLLSDIFGRAAEDV